ncbi:MAG: PEP-CTERM/exosortase system-associated acyltransferase [Gammaproteobacteria bacterium]
MNQLIAAFEAYFRVINADTPQLLREVFRLRYQVYCEDTQLADGVLFPERLESDEYDQRSVHMLLQHRPSGHYVGTMRLVLPDPADPNKPFPIEELARFAPAFAGVPREERRYVAEVSRFAILHHFPHHEPRRVMIHHERRRIPRYGAGERPRKSRLRFPHPMLALVFGLVRLSVEHEITHWYAMMAPSLDRLLSHYSLHLQAVGPTFDLHGERRAHFDSIQNFLDRAYCSHPEVWELITDCGRLWPEPKTKNNCIEIHNS